MSQKTSEQKKEKQELRKEMLEKRNALAENEVIMQSMKIGNVFFELEEFKKSKVICFYLAKKKEVRTEKMIAEAIKNNKKITVPVTDHKITFAFFTSFDDLEPAKFGVPEPKTKKPLGEDEEPDIIIVPGLAFDIMGQRLGYGKGYYDRLLKTLSKTVRIGIAFDFQVIEKIPADTHDEKMDYIITESRMLKIKKT